MKQLAIIGPTASGKSDLALSLAENFNAYILSIDSLSIYKNIDIVSAKPSKKELQRVKHFGVDFIYPDEYFSVDIFIDLYKQVSRLCHKEGKNLIIVGGTSFYLKSLLDGLSPLPKITNSIKKETKQELENLSHVYNLLQKIDPKAIQKISPTDSYRLEKMLLIYKASGISASEWFAQNPPQPIIENLAIYNIEVERELLRNRIRLRTKKMLEMGLIDEVSSLEQRYTRAPNAMGAIGVVEVLEYLDAKVTKPQMVENIITHTAQLAKRQQTFNKTQFKDAVTVPLKELQDRLQNIYIK